MALLDVFTLEQAKKGLNVTVPVTQDPDIQGFVTAISQRFDDPDICGPVVQRTITAEITSGGRAWVRLKHRPIVSVASVTIGGTVTTAYVLDPDEGLLWSDAGFTRGRRNISVTYTAGRFATTAEVTERFIHAAQITFAHLWTAERGAGSSVFGNMDQDYQPRYGMLATGVPSFAIPKAAREILGSEFRGPQAWVV